MLRPRDPATALVMDRAPALTPVAPVAPVAAMVVVRALPAGVRRRMLSGMVWHVSPPPLVTSEPTKRYRLLGPDGRPVLSATKGRWGGHRAGRLYGRLDCRSALRAVAAVAAGGYVTDRVFFATASDAVAAGYRPCARCCPVAYHAWVEAGRPQRPRARPSVLRPVR